MGIFRGIRVTIFAILVGLFYQGSAHATLITGSLDPDYTTTFQGASAATFASLGYTVGTGASDLKVDTGTFADPSGLIFGSALSNLGGGASGTTTDKMTYGYFTYGPSLATANARDYNWLQNTGTNGTTSTALDTPWFGTIFDLGGQANQAVVFPIVDHGPLPQEVVEYTVYLGNDPLSTSLADWNLATLDTVYMQGWESDSTALADGFTTVWKLPADQTFRYVSVEAIGSQAIQPLFGNEDEIDAVAGLTAEGKGVGSSAVPEPASMLLFGTGLVGALIRKRRVS